MQAFELPNISCRLRFHDLPGNEPTILFVHGLGCASSCDYPRVAADPALAGRRKLLIDLLGSGFSDRPLNFGYAVEDHAGTLCLLIEYLGLSSVDLVGHSMGGAIAIEVATRHPRAVRRLILSEPNLDAGGGIFSRPIAQQNEAEYIAAGHAKSVRSAMLAGQATWSASLMMSSPLAVYRSAASLVRGGSPSWREQLRALRIPRTVIFGVESLPDPDTEQLSQMGVSVRIVLDAGHSMMHENPTGFAEAVSAALR